MPSFPTLDCPAKAGAAGGVLTELNRYRFKFRQVNRYRFKFRFGLHRRRLRAGSHPGELAGGRFDLWLSMPGVVYILTAPAGCALELLSGLVRFSAAAHVGHEHSVLEQLVCYRTILALFGGKIASQRVYPRHR